MVRSPGAAPAAVGPPTAQRGPLLAHLRRRVHKGGMLFQPLPDPAADREREFERNNPERETLWLAAAGAAEVLGAQHSVTRAFAQAAATMDRVDLWHARRAMKTLRLDQRQAIAEAAES